MEDGPIHERIEQLVAEEHELYERASGGLSDTDRRRLESITRRTSSKLRPVVIG